MNSAPSGETRLGRVCPAFADALMADRETFNAKFEDARRLHPDMDAAAFSAFLTHNADPVVDAVAALDECRARDTAAAVFDIALTLVGERLAGPGGRYPLIGTLWQEFLPMIAPLVAHHPEAVVSSMTNALFNICATPGARPGDWLASMVGITPSLASLELLLRAGQVAAWTSGLAHYREGALAAADALPPETAARLLGFPHAEWQTQRERLHHDPWWNPAHANTPAGPRIVASAGAFRGFGGLFPNPPSVRSVDGYFLVTSGGECWQLTADAFGATFHRVGTGHADPVRNPDLKWNSDQICVDGFELLVPAIGRITSAARSGNTLAVTGDLTHAVTLIALD